LRGGVLQCRLIGYPREIRRGATASLLAMPDDICNSECCGRNLTEWPMADGKDRSSASSASDQHSPGWANRAVGLLTGLSLTIAAGAGLAVTVIQSSQSVRDALKLQPITSDQAKLPIKDFVEFTERCGNFYFESSDRRFQEWALSSFVCNDNRCVVDQYDQQYLSVAGSQDPWTKISVRTIFEYSKLGDVVKDKDTAGNLLPNVLSVKCNELNCMRAQNNGGMSVQNFRFTDEGCANDFKKFLEQKKLSS
jgi:hypothetical protein